MNASPSPSAIATADAPAEAPPSTMAAAVITAPRTVRLVSTQRPQPRPREVRVKLEGCGVCGSNVPPWEGRPWFEYPMAPGTLGHEGWGRVDAVGDEVNHLKPGQRIAFISHHAYAEYDVVDATAAVALPPELDGTPFPGEPLACAINVFRRSEIQRGQTVAIVGIGFLGAMLTQLCRNAGAQVIAISRRPSALAMSWHMGAAHTIELGEPRTVIEAVKAITSGALLPRVIEATGLQAPLDLAGELCAERGRLIIAGYHQDGPRQVNMQQWNWRGFDVVNAHERDPAVYTEGLRLAVQAVVRGELNPTPLYTHTYRLAELGEALEATRVRPDGFMKALVRMNDGQDAPEGLR